MRDKPNKLGLIEYSRQDIFVDTTDAVREADRFYIMIEADEVFAEKDKEIAELKEQIKILEELGACKRGCVALRHNQRRVETEKYKVECKNKEIESLKASHYAESVDAGMRERRLRRAFYKACANWAHVAVAFFSSYETKERWHKMERKCRVMADKYGEGK